MNTLSYDINKGVNRPIEFKGIKAQYIIYLATGLALLLIAFSVMYITGIPVYLCVALTLTAGTALFIWVYRYSHKYGEHGLMKALAYRKIPAAIRPANRKPFLKLIARKTGN